MSWFRGDRETPNSSTTRLILDYKEPFKKAIVSLFTKKTKHDCILYDCRMFQKVYQHGIEPELRSVCIFLSLQHLGHFSTPVLQDLSRNILKYPSRHPEYIPVAIRMDGTIKPSQLSVESASTKTDSEFDFMEEFLSDAILSDPSANKNSTPSSSDNHEGSDVDFSQIFWADYEPHQDINLLETPLLTPGLTAVPTVMQTQSVHSSAPANVPAASQVDNLSEQFQSDFTFSDVPLPMLSFEPRYHPAIGWYFPAAPQTSFPSTTSDVHPHAQMGAVPAESSTQTTQQPTKTEETAHNDGLVLTFQHTVNGLSSIQTNKRKCDDQISKTTKGKKKADDTIGNIVKCTCKKDANHIPRPVNAFFIYRSALCKDLFMKHPSHSKVSKIVAENWQNESEEVKAKYRALAQEERKLHKLKYPDYKYHPRSRSKYLKDHQRTCALRKYSEQTSDEASPTSDLGADLEQDEFGGDTDTDNVLVVRRSARNKKRAI